MTNTKLGEFCNRIVKILSTLQLHARGRFTELKADPVSQHDQPCDICETLENYVSLYMKEEDFGVWRSYGEHTAYLHLQETRDVMKSSRVRDEPCSIDSHDPACC